MAPSSVASERISIAGRVEIALGESTDDPGSVVGISFLYQIEDLLSFMTSNILFQLIRSRDKRASFVATASVAADPQTRG